MTRAWAADVVAEKEIVMTVADVVVAVDSAATAMVVVIAVATDVARLTEVADVVIRDGVLVSGRLFGAAVCKAGAFPSATVYASDVGDLPEDSGAAAPVTTENSEEVDAVSVATTTADGATLDAEAVTITQDAEVVTTYDDGQTVETITEVSHDEVTYETQQASGDTTQDPGAAQASEQDADATPVAEEASKRSGISGRGSRAARRITTTTSWNIVRARTV